MRGHLPLRAIYNISSALMKFTSSSKSWIPYLLYTMLLPTLSLHPKRLHVDLMICRRLGLSSSLKSMTHSCWDLCMPPFRRILIYTKQQVPRNTTSNQSQHWDQNQYFRYRLCIYNHHEALLIAAQQKSLVQSMHAARSASQYVITCLLCQGHS